MHFAVTSFWDQYDLLPPSIKRLAEKNYQLLKQNPKHPSLHFKKIRQQLYSVRVGEHYGSPYKVMEVFKINVLRESGP